MGGRNMKSPFTPLLLCTTLTFILRGNYRVVVPTTGSFFLSLRGNYELHFLVHLYTTHKRNLIGIKLQFSTPAAATHHRDTRFISLPPPL